MESCFLSHPIIYKKMLVKRIEVLIIICTTTEAKAGNLEIEPANSHHVPIDLKHSATNVDVHITKQI